MSSDAPASNETVSKEQFEVIVEENKNLREELEALNATIAILFEKQYALNSEADTAYVKWHKLQEEHDKLARENRQFRELNDIHMETFARQSERITWLKTRLLENGIDVE